MLARFHQHIQKNFSFLLESKLLLAISGGLDSVVLAHLLSKLNFTVGLAHVNFQLRGADSNQDEDFVKALGKQLNNPVFTFVADTNTYKKEHNMSVQMAAREIRYAWFEKLLDTKEYDYVLTAHHQDDAIETFFINISRSAGLEGLTGIPEINNKIIRPLLAFTRDEIRAYAKANNISWREDASNATTNYLRNKIRHKLLPVLKEISPGFEKACTTTLSHLKESQSLVTAYISQIKPKVCEYRNNLQFISLQKLEKLPNQKAILYELLKKYGFTQWDDIYNLVNAQPGKQVYSTTHYLLKDREFLVLGVVKKEIGNKREAMEVENGFRTHDLKFKISNLKRTKTLDFKSTNLNEVYLDASKIEFPLFVRKWQKGDYFYPLGLQGKKKISEFLIDIKIPLVEKKNIWLLCDAQDQIIWVIGKRIDNRYKITDKTTKLLMINQHE